MGQGTARRRTFFMMLRIAWGLSKPEPIRTFGIRSQILQRQALLWISAIDSLVDWLRYLWTRPDHLCRHSDTFGKDGSHGVLQPLDALEKGSILTMPPSKSMGSFAAQLLEAVECLRYVEVGQKG